MKQLLLLIFALFIAPAVADTETINWYDDGNVYDTTTCQSGGDIILPTPPTKTGYTFTGWAANTYDFSTLDTSLSGVTAFSRGGGRCRENYEYVATCHPLLHSGSDWIVAFRYGYVYGTALCSPTPGENKNTTGNPDTSVSGINCWCRATMFVVPNGDTTIMYNPSPITPWVYYTVANSISICESNCPWYCSLGVRDRELLLIFGNAS